MFECRRRMAARIVARERLRSCLGTVRWSCAFFRHRKKTILILFPFLNFSLFSNLPPKVVFWSFGTHKSSGTHNLNFSSCGALKLWCQDSNRSRRPGYSISSNFSPTSKKIHHCWGVRCSKPFRHAFIGQHRSIVVVAFCNSHQRRALIRRHHTALIRRHHTTRIPPRSLTILCLVTSKRKNHIDTNRYR